MENSIAPSVSNKDGFFNEKSCINCSVDEFCVCDGANSLFDIEGVMKQKLVAVGQDIKISVPLKVDILPEASFCASFSHKGILASCGDGTIKFTNINNNSQVEIKVEAASHAGFYDNVILLLTLDNSLREASVEEVFENPIVETFKIVEGTSNVFPWTDVSLLHVRRILYYPTTSAKLYSFNVDTRENTRVDVGKKVLSIASLTGIDCGVKVMFQACRDYCTYALNMDNTVTKLNDKEDNWLTALFPSASNPKNMNNAVFKYWDELMKGNHSWTYTKHVMNFDYHYAVMRVYKDIFLAFDRNIKSWVLVRIVTP